MKHLNIENISKIYDYYDNSNLGFVNYGQWGDTIIDISSYAGTDIKVVAGHIFTTSGSTGDLSIFDADYAKVNTDNITIAQKGANPIRKFLLKYSIFI